MDLGLGRLRKNSHRNGAGLNSTAFLGGRNSLPAMPSRLAFERLFGSLTRDFEDAESGTFLYDSDVKDTSGLLAEGKWPSALLRAASHRRRPLRRVFR